MDAPQNLIATANSDRQITLKWDAPEGSTEETIYKVYKCVEIASLKDNTMTDAGLEPLTDYFYAVRTYAAGDNASGFSPVVAVKTFETPNPGVYYVAPYGNDAGNGSNANPFKTIQKGIDVLVAGDTLRIRAGTYSEKIVVTKSGAAGKYITIENNGTDKVIMDASGVSGSSPCVTINGQSYIRIKGIEICNCTAPKAKGIYIGGPCTGIEIRNNKIHDMKSTTGGNGIQVRGTDGGRPISGLIISGNEIYDNVLGAGEACMINGNVTDFQITGNTIHDNNNKGITIAGFFGIAASNDQARKGLVSQNVVYNITSADNPAFGGTLGAIGIYVDGGKDVMIERNLIHHCDIAVETGNGHKDLYTSNIIVRNNIIHGSNTCGLRIGGAGAANGYCTDSWFYNNTLYNNSVGIRLQKSNNNYIFNNIIFEDGSMQVITLGTATMQNNIWFRTSGNNQGLTFFDDPEFVNAAGGDFSVKSTSPAVNAGIGSLNAHSITDDFGIGFGDGTLDFKGEPRIENGNVDCGAIETVISVNPTGKVYYVSSSAGSDSNTGLSPAAPLKTIAKVNSLPLSAGDVVRFRCGDVWRREYLTARSGNSTSDIVYSSYGTGNKPLFIGSVSKSLVSDWTNAGTNLWECSVPSGLGAGNVILNNSQCAHRVENSSDLSTQYNDSANGNWWYDTTNNKIRMYLPGNPASRYSSVEIAAGTHMINLRSVSHITFDGLAFKYGGRHAFSVESCDHISIINCDVGFIGGTYQRGTLRYGNGIEFWADNHDHLVRNCNVFECFDAGVTNQSTTACNQYNIVYDGNKIWNCEYSYETWLTNSQANVHDVTFMNNECRNAGGGFGHYQRPDATGYHLQVGITSATNSNIRVTGNVFYKAARTLIWKPSGMNSIVIDRNIYSQVSGQNLARYNANWYTINQSANYKTATGQDANSQFNIL